MYVWDVKCYNIKELILQKKLTVINQINEKNVLFVIIVILKIWIRKHWNTEYKTCWL